MKLKSLLHVLCAACLLLPVAGHADDPAIHAARTLTPESDLVGELQSVLARHEDTLIDIARAHGLGYHAIRNANPGVDPWLPGDGTRVLLPRLHVLPQAHRSGIVINLPEMRLYDFTLGDGQLMTYAISIGQMEWSTPLGTLSVIEKREQPAWHPPASIREAFAARGEPLPAQVPPGPDNPLGEFAMRLSNPSYLIHGTNWPLGIGMRATHGCIRLAPADIEHLFSRIPVGTKVHIVNEPVKAGWSGDTLYLEAHPVLEELTEPNNLTPAVHAVVAATRERPARVDWAAVKRVAMTRTGIPEPVGVFETESETVQAAAEDLPVPESLVQVDVSTASGSLSGWYVQLGSFGNLDNAQRFAQRLEEAGFTAHIGEYRRDGQALMRVLVGPQESVDEARALAGFVRQAVGQDGHVVRLNTTQ
jgi:L,D-transpeptidase ErfK/SrfK